MAKKNVPLEKKDNEISLAVIQIRQRADAKKALIAAKKLEKEKSTKGFEWIRLGKIAKQVAPEFVSTYLNNGWKLAHL